MTDAGGKSSANLHLDTKEYGVLKIAAEKDLLANFEQNVLYKPFGARVIGKQNLKTGEIDRGDLRLVEIIDYAPAYKEDYLFSLIKKARKSWVNVPDADEWLKNMRGYGA